VAYVYLLRCAGGSFYTGWTTDLAARLAAHQAGRGSRYTRARRPVTLTYWEELPTESAARRREPQLKRLSHAAKELLCRQSLDRDAQPGAPAHPAGGQPSDALVS
jgi:putative endonuclease